MDTNIQEIHSSKFLHQVDDFCKVEGVRYDIISRGKRWVPQWQRLAESLIGWEKVMAERRLERWSGGAVERWSGGIQDRGGVWGICKGQLRFLNSSNESMFNPFRHSRAQAPSNGPIGDERLVPALDFVPEPKRLFWPGSAGAQKAPIPLPKELRVLIVGDSTNDELMIVNELNWGGFEVRHKRVDTMAAVHTALLGNAWDLIICDYCLRATNGVSVLMFYREMNLEIPFIMISDMGEDLAADVIKAGAKGYITKQNLAPLAPAVKRELRAVCVRQIL